MLFVASSRTFRRENRDRPGQRWPRFPAYLAGAAVAITFTETGSRADAGCEEREKAVF